MTLRRTILMCLGLAMAAPAVASDYAVEVAGSSTLGYPPYDYAGAALGAPARSFYDWATPNIVFKSSVVAGPFQGLRTDCPDSAKVVVTIKTNGYLILGFDQPIEDDPLNWFGKDFIVFGNAAFNGSGIVPGYVEPDTDMEQYFIDPYASGRWEPSTVVSVAQSASGPWFTYTNGPYADDFAPTQAYAWDYLKHAWGAEMDFTKPVDPALTKESFGAKQMPDGSTAALSAAEAIDMYKGSGGGAAFDISGLDLALNASGRKWIKYVKITARGGEVDAVSRVSHAIAPISIGEARKLPDGARVILTEQVVSAGTDSFADCCYIQSADSPFGIRVRGRIAARGQRVMAQGVMATVNGEREIQATSMEIVGDTAH